MSSDNPNPSPFASGEPNQPYTQNFKHNPATARVPDKVAQGVFSTGALVQTLQSEFAIDFVQNLSRPAQVVARVLVTPLSMQQMLNAMQENLGLYQQKFGAPPALPKPPQPPRQLSIQEIYDDLKLPDELLSGVYANTMMIGHSPGEFVLDFITSIYPKAAVSCRVFVSAAQMPRLMETLAQAYKKAVPQQPGGNPPPAAPTEP